MGIAPCGVLLVLLTAWNSAPARAAISSSLGTNFTASTYSESGWRPPDTMGAVGPNHVVLLINGRYEAYLKSTTGAPVPGEASSLVNFWRSHLGTTSSDIFDPRVVYDPFAQRWSKISLEVVPR